ncbi:MAG TPA: flagellar basal-body MS-ring/collar protein FliF, partial [Bryobacteraceae bacterium]|nr:flagellar basal-body MS-ring/collar protein FliF [Bryobacteraceae bacterium]
MKRILGNLSTSQILTILVVVGAVGTGLYYFTRWRQEGDFRPLYVNLEVEDAGAVVERLKQDGSAYRLSADGRSVMVPSAQVAEMRLSLASEGLPRNSRIGFELFDKTNFGATEFAEKINYRRALEGELERSVASLAAVEQARVHLTFPKDSVFLEARQPAKASVMVKLKPGHRLAAQNVSAISHLVSSAVESLAPEAVSVLDMQGNLLIRPRLAQTADGEPPSEAMLAFRQAVERDVVAKIATTLEPLVGADKFRASAAVECDFSSGEQSEESFDPARSVMLASQKTEESTGTSSSAGVPGTASNLPRPASQPASASGGVFRQTENITYQSSRTVRRVKL